MLDMFKHSTKGFLKVRNCPQRLNFVFRHCKVQIFYTVRILLYTLFFKLILPTYFILLDTLGFLNITPLDTRQICNVRYSTMVLKVRGSLGLKDEDIKGKSSYY